MPTALAATYPGYSPNLKFRWPPCRIGNLLAKAGISIGPYRGEHHYDQSSNGETFNEQGPSACAHASVAAKYQSVDGKENGDRTDHDLDPKANPAQAQERPGQTIFAG